MTDYSKAIPILPSTDIARSLAFYIQPFGFTDPWQ